MHNCYYFNFLFFNDMQKFTISHHQSVMQYLPRFYVYTEHSKIISAINEKKKKEIKLDFIYVLK